MPATFGKAMHRFTEAFTLVLDFDIELSDEEVYRDLSYGRDAKDNPFGKQQAPNADSSSPSMSLELS
tara:strand:+ start:12309 stop:12509 length:201 start_codon:yes stop_codon:yes gene_type:complete